MKYIILINFITGVGGAQQLCRNKYLQLSKMGFDVYVFSATKGSILIKELERFSPYFVPQLRYQPFCFSKNTISKTIHEIEKTVGRIDSDTIIDCESITNLEWGELIAKRNKCKCVGFLVDEVFSPLKSELLFLKFKFDRKEIMFTSPESIERLFEKSIKLEEAQRYCFSPYIDNVIDDVDNHIDLLEKETFDYSVGCFGRLEKEYVFKSLKLIKQFALLNPTKRFRIIVIGGSSLKKPAHQIVKLFRNINNCKLIITGLLFPVPRHLIKSLDVCISSAASSVIVAKEGVPCIYVNCLSGKAVGIMNYNMRLSDNQSARFSTNYLDFDETMEAVLFYNYCKNNQPLEQVSITNYDSVIFSEVNHQISFVTQEKKLEYYKVNSIKGHGLKFFLFCIIGKLFGPRMLYFFHVKLFRKR